MFHNVCKCNRSETHRSCKALRNEQSARCMIEASLRSNADVISQLNSRLQTTNDQLSDERQVIAMLANRLRGIEHVALQHRHESTNHLDVLSTKYSGILHLFLRYAYDQCDNR